jgi:hypothetical protein
VGVQPLRGQVDRFGQDVDDMKPVAQRCELVGEGARGAAHLEPTPEPAPRPGHREHRLIALLLERVRVEAPGIGAADLLLQVRINIEREGHLPVKRYR